MSIFLNLEYLVFFVASSKTMILIKIKKKLTFNIFFTLNKWKKFSKIQIFNFKTTQHYYFIILQFALTKLELHEK